MAHEYAGIKASVAVDGEKGLFGTGPGFNELSGAIKGLSPSFISMTEKAGVGAETEKEEFGFFFAGRFAKGLYEFCNHEGNRGGMYIKVVGFSAAFICGVVVYYRQGKPLKKGKEIPGSFKVGTVGYNDPGVLQLVRPRRRAKAPGIGKYLSALKRPSRTGFGFFAQAPEKGTERKLASHTVAIRLFVARDNEFAAFPDKFDECLGNRCGARVFQGAAGANSSTGRTAAPRPK
jgi:hypothetical protein